MIRTNKWIKGKKISQSLSLSWNHSRQDRHLAGITLLSPDSWIITHSNWDISPLTFTTCTCSLRNWKSRGEWQKVNESQMAWDDKDLPAHTAFTLAHVQLTVVYFLYKGLSDVLSCLTKPSMNLYMDSLLLFSNAISQSIFVRQTSNRTDLSCTWVYLKNCAMQLWLKPSNNISRYVWGPAKYSCITFNHTHHYLAVIYLNFSVIYPACNTNISGHNTRALLIDEQI